MGSGGGVLWAKNKIRFFLHLYIFYFNDGQRRALQLVSNKLLHLKDIKLKSEFPFKLIKKLRFTSWDQQQVEIYQTGLGYP